MKCVYCTSETKVTNSRPQKRTNSIWRRRLCTNCDAIFSTSEMVDYDQSFKFKTRGELEPFSRDSVLISLNGSLQHRKGALREATALTETVLGLVMTNTRTAVIERRLLVETCYEVLQRFDSVAATHYRAFHPLDS